MLAPVTSMTKAEIYDLFNKCCRHGHPYLFHYNCYLKETGEKIKIGFLDIETSNLKADFGVVLSYCIKPYGHKDIIKRVIKPKEVRSKDMDKALIGDCIKDMRKFDRVITHYGTKFDIPYLRSRALIHGLRFPKYGEIHHTDTYYMAKRLLCIHSNRQNIIAEALTGRTCKTRIKYKYWTRALQGDQESLDYILDHNIKDVIELERNYKRLVPYTKQSKKSI